MRAKKGQQSFALFDLTWECAYCCSVHVPDDGKSTANIDFDIIHKFQPEGKLAKMESVNNENNHIFTIANFR